MIQCFEVLNTLGRWLSTHLPRMSLELLVLAFVVYVSIKLLRIESPAIRHSFWCLVLVKPVVTFLLASPLSLYSFLPQQPIRLDMPMGSGPTIEHLRTDIIKADALTENAQAIDVSSSVIKIPVQAEPVSLSTWQTIDHYGIIALIWMLGSGLLALRLLIGFAYVSFLRQTAELQKTGVWVDAVAAASKTFRVHRHVRIAVSHAAHGPVLAGIVRPIILLPKKLLEELSAEQIKYIVAHELGHLRRWDNLTLLLQRMAEMLLFFHPVVWFCGWIMRREAEQACDNVVLSAYEDSARYADILTRVAEMRFSLTKRLLVNTFAAAESNLAGRIRRILTGQRARMTAGLSLASFVVLIVVGCLGLPAASMREALEEAGDKEISEANPVVDTTSTNWQTVYESSFDKEDFARYKQVHTDRGLKISPHQNSLRIHGVTTDTWWTGEDATIAIDDMGRETVEISVDFRVFNKDSYHLPLIEVQAASGEFCLFYQGAGSRGSYTARFQYLPFPLEIVEGKLWTAGYGSEIEEFHNMRILYDKRNAFVSYYVDDQLLASGKLVASVGSVKSVMLGIETPNKGDDIDLRFRNLRVRVSDVPYSPSRDAVWKTIAIAEFEDPSNIGVNIVDQKGSGLRSVVEHRAGRTRGTSKSDDAYSAFKMKVVGDTGMHSDAYGDASTSSTSSGRADLSFAAILTNGMKLELRRTMGTMLSDGCRIVTDGINSPFTVVEGSLFHRGHHGGAHGRMRISIDREANRISYYAATSLLCVLQMQEQPVQIKEVLLETRLPRKGTKVSARLDNLTVRSLGRLAEVPEANYSKERNGNELDLSALQGIWIETEVADATQAKSKFVVRGNSLEFLGANPQERYKGAFTLAASSEPKQLIATIEESSLPAFVGKRVHAIYKIEGHVLTIAWHEPGSGTVPEYFARSHARVFVLSSQQYDGSSMKVISPAPLDLLEAKKEVDVHYAKAHPEVQEYLLWTARTFGASGLWLNEDAFASLSNEERDKKVKYLAILLEESEYGRHLCRGLAEASALRDTRLVPGLIKVAGYHQENANYDCRPKWIAVAALARQESDDSVPLLIGLVDHGNQNTRNWARAALSRMTGQDFKNDQKAWAEWLQTQGGRSGADSKYPR